jgi:hypothetical protein
LSIDLLRLPVCLPPTSLSWWLVDAAAGRPSLSVNRNAQLLLGH